ncbi:hypothetical protein ISCGN_031651 [Ixodes scapularis]
MSVLVELATSPSRLRRRTTDLSELARGDRKATSAGHNNNNIEVPEYIVDPETKITYLKGKFLGKVGCQRCFVRPFWSGCTQSFLRRSTTRARRGPRGVGADGVSSSQEHAY